MATWIDFRELRQKLHFADVLQHYNVQTKVKGERAYALCPLPGHPKRRDGRRRTASLSVNLARNIFQCFGGCHAGGNAIEFVAIMEGLDPRDADQFRHAALKAVEIFGIELSGREDNRKQKRIVVKSAESKEKMKPEEPSATALPVMVNARLDFELKHLDPAHPYLASRGFTPETIEHFGLGYCSKGMMEDRIAIPVHNSDGQLVAYAGRLTDERSVSDEKPKYLFPGPRERDGKKWEFHKSELLYNLHRIKKPADELIVVEGFASVWWLHQQGWPNTVALMGNSMSSAQADAVRNILHINGRLWILTDGDQAGERCAVDVFQKVSPDRFVRWIRLTDRQPTDLPKTELAKHLLF